MAQAAVRHPRVEEPGYRLSRRQQGPMAAYRLDRGSDLVSGVGQTRRPAQRLSRRRHRPRPFEAPLRDARRQARAAQRSSTPMQREASSWKGHKRWLAARTTAILDSRGSRRTRTTYVCASGHCVLTDLGTMTRLRQANTPSRSRPISLRSSGSLSWWRRHLAKERLTTCEGCIRAGMEGSINQ